MYEIELPLFLSTKYIVLVLEFYWFLCWNSILTIFSVYKTAFYYYHLSYIYLCVLFLLNWKFGKKSIFISSKFPSPSPDTFKLFTTFLGSK